nr:MAG: hypothetical protein [Bacteriophage sp.]
MHIFLKGEKERKKGVERRIKSKIKIGRLKNEEARREA